MTNKKDDLPDDPEQLHEKVEEIQTDAEEGHEEPTEDEKRFIEDIKDKERRAEQASERIQDVYDDLLG